jgi:hypothetical protein
MASSKLPALHAIPALSSLHPMVTFPIQHFPGLWRHQEHFQPSLPSVSTIFIQYTKRKPCPSSRQYLAKYYTISTDWSGESCGLTLREIIRNDMSTSPCLYVQKAQKFQHPRPARSPTHAPHDWIRPAYGAKIQYCNEADLPAADQQPPKESSPSIAHFFLRSCVDPILLVALN